MKNDTWVDNRNTQLQRALCLLQHFEENKDWDRFEKVKKLIKKIDHQELLIAFSGHFSAGKSSMINDLIGEEIVPTGPIPTSANVVKIHRADSSYAKVYFQDGAPILFTEPYSFSDLSRYCKDGAVTEIEIGHSHMKIPTDITIMDTPGIDSTDEAHRFATESELHIADIVFYVMDYNHVQAEQNLLFTKNLSDHGVAAYLIINQIDKHDDEEMSFDDYKQSVLEAFSKWNIQYKGIFFTSLKQKTNQRNELSILQKIIQETIEQKTDWLNKSYQTICSQLEAEHNQWLEDELKEATEPLEEVLSNYTQAELEEMKTKQESFSRQKSNLNESIRSWSKRFDHEGEKLLQNANIMPYETRELARQMLESQQPQFKMGLLFSKKKTKEEQEKRLQAFGESVRTQIEAQLIWHIRQWLATELQKANIHDSTLQSEVQQFSFHLSNDVLIQTIKSGAALTGEYVLIYCEDVTNQIKKKIRLKLQPTKEEMTLYIKNAVDNQIIEIDGQLETLHTIIAAINAYEQVKAEYAKKMNFSQILPEHSMQLLHKIRNEWEILESSVVHYPDLPSLSDQQTVSKSSELIEEESIKSLNDSHIINKIMYAVDLLQYEPLFKRTIESIQSKVNRIMDKQYTVALFGAFSAGKSTLANALLEDAVLPVSPNPTTAAINRICPPNETYTHQEAVVYFKRESDLLEELKQILSLINEACTSIQDAQQKIAKLMSQGEIKNSLRLHQSFFAAFLEGYEEHIHLLGRSLKTNIKGFQQYVGLESKSCFVESIDLYYDCPITRKGITLVDTPGADSIHSRHTNLTFDYIKNADALLFVSYYNHAFSRADRDFLMQLGRVKDTFELDKMFFIVNAIDLANNEDEAASVMEYVSEELLQNGIRNPRLFGVSSKFALSKETREHSGLAHLTEKFYDFLENEINKMALMSADQEYQKLLNILDEIILSASENEEDKYKKREKLRFIQKEVEEKMKTFNFTVLNSQLQQEVDELLYYVKQRVHYRFSEFFREAFNPAVLTDQDKKKLDQCLEELIRLLNFEFTQEFRATTLRVERFIEKGLNALYYKITSELSTIYSSISISPFLSDSKNNLEFDSFINDVNREPLKKQFKYFKNPKSFFEKGENKVLEAVLETEINTMIDDKLEQVKLQFVTTYEGQLEKQFEQLLIHVHTDFIDQYDAWVAALTNEDQLSSWISVQKKLLSFS